MHACSPACGKKNQKHSFPAQNAEFQSTPESRIFGDSNRRSNGYVTADILIMPEVEEIE